MQSVYILLNTNNVNPNKGYLETIGDTLLMPLRVYYGKNFRIVNGVVHSVESYHKDGTIHVSATDPTLKSEPFPGAGADLNRAGLHVVIFGTITGVFFKTTALLFDPEARNTHTIIRSHYAKL